MTDPVETDPLETDPAETGPGAPPGTGLAAPPSRTRRRRLDPVPVLLLLGLLILGGGVAWLLYDPHQLPGAVTSPAASPAADIAATVPPAANTEDQITALNQRLGQLSSQPTSADLARLNARLAALESAKPAMAPAPDQAALASLTTRLDALDKHLSALDDALRQQAARTQHLARLQQAATALMQGQPLGDLPDAPPALAGFAHTPPPTEAALRLRFASFAAAAHAASRPEYGHHGFWARIWARVQSLVTLRQGERVLVGDPTAGILAACRDRLEAGDLAGAVQALNALQPRAAGAIAPWRRQAQSLLDARAALLAAEQRG